MPGNASREPVGPPRTMSVTSVGFDVGGSRFFLGVRCPGVSLAELRGLFPVGGWARCNIARGRHCHLLGEQVREPAEGSEADAVIVASGRVHDVMRECVSQVR